ncbi:hypothetical protein GF319_01990, partial [Candidatus Bathyarchaeota archaeon]|nr:hypothetical protein [Candidatus Bathyarchaeota archaeon]
MLFSYSAQHLVSASVGQPKGRYIVVLEEGVDPRAVAKAHGLTPAHVYNHALKGFSAVGVTHGIGEGS